MIDVYNFIQQNGSSAPKQVKPTKKPADIAGMFASGEKKETKDVKTVEPVNKTNSTSETNTNKTLEKVIRYIILTNTYLYFSYKIFQ